MKKLVRVGFVIALAIVAVHNGRCWILGARVLWLGQQAMDINAEQWNVWRDDAKLCEVRQRRNDKLRERNLAIEKYNQLLWFTPKVEKLEVPAGDSAYRSD